MTSECDYNPCSFQTFLFYYAEPGRRADAALKNTKKKIVIVILDGESTSIVLSSWHSSLLSSTKCDSKLV